MFDLVQSLQEEAEDMSPGFQAMVRRITCGVLRGVTPKVPRTSNDERTKSAPSKSVSTPSKQTAGSLLRRGVRGYRRKKGSLTMDERILLVNDDPGRGVRRQAPQTLAGRHIRKGGSRDGYPDVSFSRRIRFTWI